MSLTKREKFGLALVAPMALFLIFLGLALIASLIKVFLQQSLPIILCVTGFLVLVVMLTVGLVLIFKDR